MLPREVEAIREVLEDAKIRFSEAWAAFDETNAKIIKDMGKIGDLADDKSTAFPRFFYTDDNDNEGTANRLLRQLDRFESEGEMPAWFCQL